MNFNINLPFVDLKFLESQEKHKKFFDDLLFKSSLETKKEFFVSVKFNKEIKFSEKTYIENNCVANSNDFIILDTKRSKCKLNFNLFTKKKISIELEDDFDLYYFFTFILEPLIIIWSAHHEVLYLHSSGIAKNEKITLFPAWRNTGKTNTILDLCQKGYSFCGDDFCVVKNKTAYLYPKSLNLFSYNLKSFPNVLNHIDWKTSLRLKITTKLKKQLFSLSQSLSGPLSKIFFRISELAEVSTNIKLKPSQLNIKTCEKGGIKDVFILQKSNLKRTTNKNLSNKNAENKIFKTIQYELKDFFEIYYKYLYLFPETNIAIVNQFEKNYKRLISDNLSEFKIRYLEKNNQ
jgi:hypothetical protein